MKIGSIDFGERPVFLAPMEDVTDASFRLLCKEFGASLVYTEFVSADALVRGIGSTMRKMQVADVERPVAIQIYGRDTETMVEAAKICEEARPDILDINFGCPVKRVASKGAGSGLLRNIPLMLDITREVAKAVSIPVTVKTRLGWDANDIVIETLAEQLQDAGAAAITIHGRTRSQMYKGVADWGPIARVAANPRITVPIIGNGDILTGDDALMRFETTGVDAVMIGRGSIGRPWMFEGVKAGLRGEERPRHDFSWYMDVLKRQVNESIDKCGEYGGILHIRRHIAMTPIFKGIPDFKSMRIALLRAGSKAELFELLDDVPRKFDISVVDLDSPNN
ncbi:tRNA dihydrouridine synthase DusB [Porphyromonas sp.]|uniref:tRNA dihydrouridine synthase DusB n=1 Tax=Porphyromonas sp. TaxID=1924944 RepID=UPI0026DD6009|nr:tRNA dihydrouridine synthase DusB [Porphyromonas sp.]MDO4771630.1 tRNA dihydrouridine synthase DusB [Porphyromonas sp.]